MNGVSGNTLTWERLFSSDAVYKVNVAVLCDFCGKITSQNTINSSLYYQPFGDEKSNKCFYYYMSYSNGTLLNKL